LIEHFCAGSNEPIHVILLSLEISSPLAELEYNDANFGHVMKSELEQMPMLLIATYGWCRH